MLAKSPFLAPYFGSNWRRLSEIHFSLFVSVVGEKEMTNKTVNVRTRDNKVHGELSLEALKEKFEKLTVDRILKSEEMEPESQ